MIAARLVALLLILLPWWEGGASPFGIALTQTLLFLAVAAVLAGSFRSGALELRCGWEGVAAGALMGVSLLSAACGRYLFGTFLATWDRIAAMLLALALLLLLGSRTRSDGIPLLWTTAMAIAGGAQGALVLLQSAPANLTPSGSFANANHLGAWLNLSILTCAGGIAEAGSAESARGRLARRALFGGAMLLGVAALLRTGSRAALGSLILVAAFWLVRSRRSAPSLPRRWLWAGVALLAIATAASIATRFDRISDPYRWERLRIWGSGISAMADHPLLGLGPGLFEPMGQRYNFPLEDEMFRYSKRASSAHSTLVQAGAETGLPGLLATALLMALLGWKATRMASLGQRGSGQAMGLLACLLHSLVDTPFAVPAITLSALALSIPWLLPSSMAEAAIAMHLAWPAGRRGRAAGAAAALVLLYLLAGGVLLPYAAHRLYQQGAERGQPGRPSSALDRAIRLGPLNPLYRVTRAQLLQPPSGALTLESFARADGDLRAALELNPEAPSTLLALARLHAKACFDLSAEAATAARAERYYRAAIATGLKDPRPHLELAAFLLSAGRLAEAIPLLRQAIALEPRFLRAHRYLARALGESGQPEAAREAEAALARAREDLRGYQAKNGYEADLMREDR